MTEPGLEASSQTSLDQLEADYRRLSEQLARAEHDYLELLEQTDRDRAAALTEVTGAHDTAAQAVAEAAATLDRARAEAERLQRDAARAGADDAERLRQEAARDAAALRQQAANDADRIRAEAGQEAAALRQEARQEHADVVHRREQADRLQQAAVEARTRAELDLADVLARREQVQLELDEAVARRAQAQRDLEEAAWHATHVRDEAEREAQEVRAEAAEAMAAIERLRAEHTVLRHALATLPNPSAGAHARAVDVDTSAPIVHIPPRLVVVALAMVVVCAVGAYMVASLGDKVYGGRVEILVDVPSTSSTAERQLATQRVLIESQVVLGEVASDAGISTDEVEDSLRVEAVGSSEVLRLTVGDEDPEVAVERAQAIADRYIDLVENVGDAGAGVPAVERPTDAQLIAPARLLDDPIAPRPIRAAAGGAMAGIFLGGAIIGVYVLLQRWRRSAQPSTSGR